MDFSRNGRRLLTFLSDRWWYLPIERTQEMTANIRLAGMMSDSEKRRSLSDESIMASMKELSDEVKALSKQLNGNGGAGIKERLTALEAIHKSQKNSTTNLVMIIGVIVASFLSAGSIIATFLTKS